MTPEVKLDKDEFKSWLESRPEGEVVGVIESSLKCPIARYLNDKFPLSALIGDSWMVNSTHFHARWSGKWELLPNWAKDFVITIDKSTVSEDKLVNREQCLEAL